MPLSPTCPAGCFTKAGRIDPGQNTGMDMDHMNMPGIDHSKMDHSNMPGMKMEKSPAKNTKPTMEEHMKMNPNMKM